MHEGVLLAADEGRIDLDIDGTTRTIPVDRIASARTVVDWSAELKGTSV